MTMMMMTTVVIADVPVAAVLAVEGAMPPAGISVAEVVKPDVWEYGPVLPAVCKSL